MSSDSSKSEEVEPIINQPEDFPEKKKFNTDAPGQKIFEQQDDIDTYRNPTKTEDADDKKSKDDNPPEQNQACSGQNAQKLGSTSSKEEDMEKEWIFLDNVPDVMTGSVKSAPVYSNHPSYSPVVPQISVRSAWLTISNDLQ